MWTAHWSSTTVCVSHPKVTWGMYVSSEQRQEYDIDIGCCVKYVPAEARNMLINLRPVKNIQTPRGLFFITKNAMLGDLHGARKVQEIESSRE